MAASMPPTLCFSSATPASMSSCIGWLPPLLNSMPFTQESGSKVPFHQHAVNHPWGLDGGIPAANGWFNGNTPCLPLIRICMLTSQ